MSRVSSNTEAIAAAHVAQLELEDAIQRHAALLAMAAALKQRAECWQERCLAHQRLLDRFVEDGAGVHVAVD